MDIDAAARQEVPAKVADTRTLVWDFPVRVFHWLLAFSVLGAWATSEGDRWQQVHVALGYTVAILVAFRLVWGLVGTRHARFANFVRAPRAVVAHVGDLLQGRAHVQAGHNPAGALAILLMLVLLTAAAATGWATYREVAGEWMEDIHETLANLLLGLAAVHVGAVLLMGWLERQSLIVPMISGRKRVPHDQGIRRPWRGVGVLLLAGVLAFWWVRWENAPQYAAGAPHRQVEPDEDD